MTRTRPYRATEPLFTTQIKTIVCDNLAFLNPDEGFRRGLERQILETLRAFSLDVTDIDSGEMYHIPEAAWAVLALTLGLEFVDRPKGSTFYPEDRYVSSETFEVLGRVTNAIEFTSDETLKTISFQINLPHLKMSMIATKPSDLTSLLPPDKD